MSNRPRRAPSVPVHDPTRRLLGRDDPAALNTDRPAVERIRLGGQIDAERDEFRGLTGGTFATATAGMRRLRSATEKALGRRLGGVR